MVMKSKRQIEW